MEDGDLSWADCELVFQGQDTAKYHIENDYCIQAFCGSLDAAKALRDAVLQGASQYSIITDPTCICVKVCWWPNGLSDGTEIHGKGWSESNPSRAWLLAILRALIAEAKDASHG